MKRFDVLDRSVPVLGKKIIEASAGTGKTFAIEHIVVRLLQESDLKLDQILVVTFTRAATRELKMRIRANLEKHHPQAVRMFDQAQIFTIHGFCQKILGEYAFEAGVGCDLREWNPSEEFDLFLQQAVSTPAYAAAQVINLLKRYPVEKLQEMVVKERRSSHPLADFPTLFQAFQDQLQHVERGGDFLEAAKNYKRMTEADFIEQAVSLDKMIERRRVTHEEFNRLLRKRPYFLNGFRRENLKVKGVSCPSFEKLQEALCPILDLAGSPDKILKRLVNDWHAFSEKRMVEEERLSFDSLLTRVSQCLESPEFIARVRKRYRAAIIDEFQDTDPVQWKIFKTLFGSEATNAFYLVGDPKQSIYAFRDADIYTFLEATHHFGAENRAYLDTNFRSEKGLVAAMNRLFGEKEWIDLPKLQTYLPVTACAAVKEGEGLLQFVLGESEDDFFPFIVHEIGRLQLQPQEVAVLIKDRFQGMRLFDYLQRWNLPCTLRKGDPELAEQAEEAWEEVLKAVHNPENLGYVKRALLGPLMRGSVDGAVAAQEVFRGLKPILLEKGFPIFYSHLCRRNLIYLDDVSQHVAEQLAEKKEKERVCVSSKGIQILTIHASKGLEFDNVFCLGVASRTPTGDENQHEQDAEKMRQLYVAMTRAKRRLYIPVVRDGQELEPGEASPIELFLERVKPDLTTFSCIDLKRENLNLKPFASQAAAVKEKQPPPPELPGEFLLSFSGISKKQFEPKQIPENILPAGPETGIILHAIFEKSFNGKKVEIGAEVKGTILEGWEAEVQEMVDKTIALPLFQDLDRRKIGVEMEFFFPFDGHIMKGFIDLCFEKDGKYYFVDWKTNWLEAYSQAEMEKVMHAGDYFLQAKIYAEALKRLFKNSATFGGGYFIFVRGPGVYHWRERD
jgi:exodeoxyribonuclease V beta subunit